MKSQKRFLSLVIAASLVALPLVCVAAQDQSQNQANALMRGYRAGYSDGYPAGIQDSARNAERDFRAKPAFQQADRAYSSTYGNLEEYRNGYQQGFEAGYGDGYDRKSFDSTIPDDLKIREQDDSQAPTSQTTNRPDDPTTTNSNQTDNSPTTNANQTDNPTAANPGGPIMIPRDTIMRVELLSNLSTDGSREGDRFQAKVIEPREYENATVQGQVKHVQRAGRVKGTAELQLTFDEIQFADGRSAKLSAQVIEVIQTGSSEGVGKVDNEGGIKGKDSTKSDVKKVGIASGVGAAIGAIFGGGSGAVVGATIGGGTGTAGVLRERGKDIYLYRGQQMRIRTAANTEVQ